MDSIPVLVVVPLVTNPFLVLTENDIYPKILEVAVGGYAVFTCEIETRAHWTYQGNKLPENSLVLRHINLIIYDVLQNNSGLYDCTGYSGHESFDVSAELLVYSKRKDKIFPPIAEVNVGESVTFYCDSGRPARWRRNFMALPQNLKTKPSNKLVISNVNIDLEGVYICWGWDEMKNYFISSVRLVVYSETGVSPKKMSVPLDDPVTLTCHSDTAPRWEMENRPGSLPNNVRTDAASKTLVISSFKLENEGYYRCSGTRNGRHFTDRSMLLLVVGRLERIWPSFAMVDEGTEVQFNCLSSNPIRWEFNNEPLTSGQSINIRVEREKTGLYTCASETFNKLHKFKATAFLVVSYLKAIENSIQIAKKGETKFFPCDTSSITYDKHPEGKLPPGAKVTPLEQLKIKADENNHGTYTCRGIDRIGLPFFTKVELRLCSSMNQAPSQAPKRPLLEREKDGGRLTPDQDVLGCPPPPPEISGQNALLNQLHRERLKRQRSNRQHPSQILPFMDDENEDMDLHKRKKDMDFHNRYSKKTHEDNENEDMDLINRWDSETSHGIANFPPFDESSLPQFWANTHLKVHLFTNNFSWTT